MLNIFFLLKLTTAGALPDILRSKSQEVQKVLGKRRIEEVTTFERLYGENKARFYGGLKAKARWSKSL